MLVDRKELLAKLHQLPSLPLVLQEVIASFSNTDLNTTSLAHKIEHDQGLSAKVLRMANSSFYGLTRKVGSIQDAVTVLGFDTVRSLVLSSGIIRAFPSSPDSLFDRQAYWQHCYKVGTISKIIAQKLQREQQLAFTAGMFCEIGQLVLDLCIPKQFSELLQRQANSELSLLELELSELGFDHFDIGADIIRLWNFPFEIEQLLRNWNHPELQSAPTPLACIVHIAASLESELTDEAMITKLSETWCAPLKITRAQLEESLPTYDQLENIYEHDA